MTASSILLPRVKIPAIPANVELSDLYDNFNLLSDEQKSTVLENKNKLEEGRNKKSGLNVSYDLIYVDNNFFAIYKGEKHKKMLGSGAFGKVKLAQNISTSEWVALKIIKEFDIQDVEREVKALGVTGQIIGWYQRKNNKGMDQAEILMLLAPGISLSKLSRESRLLTTVEYVEIISAILKSNERLHSANLLHRDLKCSNIILDVSNFLLSIVDFGLAVEANESGNYQSRPGIGTERYLAPEIQEGTHYKDSENNTVVAYNEKTDLYAIALLAGKILGLTFSEAKGGFYYGSNDDEDLLFEKKIRGELTRKKMLNHLNLMIRPDQRSRPATKLSIAEFKSIRDEMHDLQRVIIIGCIDLQDYLVAGKSTQKKIIERLKKMDRVCFADKSGRSQMDYVKMKRLFEEKKLTVLDEVVQYNDLDKLMPAALTGYFQCLPKAKTRRYSGCVILADKQKKSDLLKEALNESGLMYITSESEMTNAIDIKYAGRMVLPEITRDCISILKNERERLEKKNEAETVASRANRITLLKESERQVDEMITNGVIKFGVFKNSLHRLDDKLKLSDKNNKTNKVVSRVFSRLKKGMDDELIANRQFNI